MLQLTLRIMLSTLQRLLPFTTQEELASLKRTQVVIIISNRVKVDAQKCHTRYVLDLLNGIGAGTSSIPTDAWHVFILHLPAFTRLYITTNNSHGIHSDHSKEMQRTSRILTHGRRTSLAFSHLSTFPFSQRNESRSEHMGIISYLHGCGTAIALFSGKVDQYAWVMK
jgi:hypothetical protein